MVLSYAIWQAMQFGTLPVILSIFSVIHFKKWYNINYNSTMITNNIINHYLSQYIFLINIKYYDLIIL